MKKRLQKRSILTIFLATVLALAMGLAVILASTLFKKKVDAQADQFSEPVITYHIGKPGLDDYSHNVFYRDDFVKGWNEAVAASLDAHNTDANSYVKVVLADNWVATDGSFGASGYFNAGRIVVPAGANIVLDLNSLTINRNLSAGVANGQVLLVQGTLNIVDEDGGGVITGGFNAPTTSTTAHGGGISITAGGTLNLYNGLIEGNTVQAATTYGAGVSVENGVFNMHGGRITSNISIATTASFGGGVCVSGSGVFNMYDGIIENHQASHGAGVACENCTADVAFNMKGGFIYNNKAVGIEGAPDSTAQFFGGGAVEVYSNGNDENSGGGDITGNIVISGGEIYRNSATNDKYAKSVYGGAVYGVLYGNAKLKITINGDVQIHDNAVWSLNTHAYGGAVAIRRASTASSGELVIGGNAKIYNNKAVTTNIKGGTYNKSNTANGGAIYTTNVYITMNGGEIYENSAVGFESEEAYGDVNRTTNGYASYGGGIYINYSTSFGISSAKLLMTNGSIYQNHSYSGGGIYDAAALDMSGGSIVNNDGEFGGGIYVPSGSTVTFSGSAVLKDNKSNIGENVANNLQILAVDGREPIIGGAFTDEAEIHMIVKKELTNTAAPITTGYGANNRKFISVSGEDGDKENGDGVWVFANPYRYFYGDTTWVVEGTTTTESLTNQRLVVLANGDQYTSGKYTKDRFGELGITDEAVKFVVTYSDSSTKEFIFGDASVKGTKYWTDWNYEVSTYGDAVYPTKLEAFVKRGGADYTTQVGETITINNEAKVNTLTVQPSTESTSLVQFSVVVKAKQLTKDDVQYTLQGADNLTYEKGKHHQPTFSSVTVNDNSNLQDTALVSGQDYTLEYDNNENAGVDTAVVTIVLKGNYAGSIDVYFTINPSSNKDTEVQWQVDKNGDGNWENVTAISEDTFTYSGRNQAGKIRAKLTDTDGSYAVYAKGVSFVGDAVEQNESMYLEFSGQGAEFVDAGTYTVTVVGNPNYGYEDGQPTTLANVKINQQVLNVSAEDYKEYADSYSVPLWRLQIGEGERVDYSVLQTTATYVVGDGADAEVKKDQTGYFARYRDVEMYLILNGEYTLKNQMTLASLLALAGNEVNYVHTASDGATTKGVRGAVTTVHTTATFTINANYALNGGTDNQITIEFEWQIVTIGNNLRTQRGAEIRNTNLGSWTFANPLGLIGDAYRAEHGDRVIYSYYLLTDDGEQFVDAFALKYSDNTANAAREFYKVTLVDGEYVLGEAINDENYLYTFNYQLRAGNYKMVVTIPELEPTAEEHTHWWEGQTANDHGVMYYELSYEFTFTVNVYEAVLVGGMDPNMTVECLTSTVEYNGLGNNIPETVVKLFNLTLIEDVDYIISTSGVYAGPADIIIEGINSVKGTVKIENKFEIVKGRNGWTQVPTIMQWTFKGYDKTVNLINATPTLLDSMDGLWFSVAYDGAGENLIEGLQKFNIELGVVDDDVAKILKSLPAGQYFLIGHVDETDNYYALEAQVIPFTVFSATNGWEVSPTVNSWTEGQFDKDESYITVMPLFGDAHIHIEDEKGNVYYDAYGEEVTINRLAEAKAGRYILTVWVDGTDDYSGLDGFFMFEVFEKPGLPWWAALLITVGALAIAAFIIFLLWKFGVFQIVTEKIVVAIRTRASVEATIASVRAAKRMEEGRKSVEDAKRRERLEKAREALEAKRNMSPEERAAALEAKAKEEAEKAEKLRARSEANRAKAEKMRSNEANGAQSEAAASDATDTPTDK